MQLSTRSAVLATGLVFAATASFAQDYSVVHEPAAVAAKPSRAAAYPAPALAALIAKHANANGVPVELAHRVIMRESRFNPAARNRAYWGLMQIRHDTARGVGYRGPAEGLLDADTNLRYGMIYLGNAYRVASGDQRRAMGLYASGYYYEAKRKGMLAQLRRAPELSGLRMAERHSPTQPE